MRQAAFVHGSDSHFCDLPALRRFDVRFVCLQVELDRFLDVLECVPTRIALANATRERGNSNCKTTLFLWFQDDLDLQDACCPPYHAELNKLLPFALSNLVYRRI